MVRQSDRFLVTDVASRNDSEIGSDHKLIVMYMHIRVNKPYRIRAARPPRKFDAQAVDSIRRSVAPSSNLSVRLTYQKNQIQMPLLRMDVSRQPTKLSQKAPRSRSRKFKPWLSLRFLEARAESQHKEPSYEQAELHDQCKLNTDDCACAWNASSETLGGSGSMIGVTQPELQPMQETRRNSTTLLDDLVENHGMPPCIQCRTRTARISPATKPPTTRPLFFVIPHSMYKRATTPENIEAVHAKFLRSKFSLWDLFLSVDAV